MGIQYCNLTSQSQHIPQPWLKCVLVVCISMFLTSFRHFESPLLGQFHNKLAKLHCRSNIVSYVTISIRTQAICFGAPPISVCTLLCAAVSLHAFWNLYMNTNLTGYSWWTRFKFGFFSPSENTTTQGCTRRSHSYCEIHHTSRSRCQYPR